ncbi:SGNH/GDSL hydrolase family protein [Luteimonas fraxinea]|uniref:SGNH/GDSL hydrolase family protein n=1 Tax=Luteimonas fraxinea TaxID=2901869 RepID=UPI001E2F3544|nr:GDSL-type esterase/lipase family protein [Luteimonas fraxinea]MCD9126411.1 GDSL-type esterase/lipase family protein [Luteimonas fraxinea]
MTAPRRYLALGDSYTIGEGIAAEDRWPVQLADALRSEGIALDAPEIIATTGWTTDELDAAIDAAAPAGPFDLVSLLIGVNDQYRGRDVAAYGPAFSALLDRATGFAGGDAARVFVLAIPDWGVTPFGAHSGRDVAAIARELNAYNAAAHAICAARGIAFVDIAPVSRARGGEAEMLADDGLHPSAALHTEWMQLALPVARGLLSRA